MAPQNDPFAKVILGGWGFGRSATALKLRKDENISASLKKYLSKTTGCYFHHRSSDGRLSWALPPLFRTLDGEIDLFPFLLYDKVMVDEEIYNLLVRGLQIQDADRACRFYFNEVLRLTEMPVRTDVALLTQLLDRGLLETIDFSSLIVQSGDILPTIAELDLNDKTIQYASLHSMSIWRSFLQRCEPPDELRQIVDTSLLLLNEATRFQDAKLAGIIDEPGVGRPFGGSEDARAYLNESLDDVNSTLLVSRLMEAPIYDWADHMPFYHVKLARSIQDVDESVQSLKKLFNIFIPQFKIEDVDELIEIKNDKRFQSLKSLMLSVSQEQFSPWQLNEMVADALTDVAKIRKKQLRFSKLVSWVTVPLSFIPGVGTFLEKATSEAADYIYSKRLESKYQWQCLFADLREKYSVDQAIVELDVNIGGSIRTRNRGYQFLDKKLELRDTEDRLLEADGERKFLRRRIGQIQHNMQRLEDVMRLEHETENSDIAYIGHRITKKFHRPECRYAEGITEDLTIRLSSIQSAVNKGYNPCKHCL